jgi:hypothetical protein
VEDFDARKPSGTERLEHRSEGRRGVDQSELGGQGNSSLSKNAGLRTRCTLHAGFSEWEGQFAFYWIPAMRNFLFKLSSQSPRRRDT